VECYEELREYVESLKIIDCHDHTGKCGPKYEDPIQVIVTYYFWSDMECVSSFNDIIYLRNPDVPLEERWPLLEKLWRKTCHTGYAQVTRRVLEKFYGEREISLDALKRMQGKLLNLEDEETFDRILGEAKIEARLYDLLDASFNVGKIIDKSLRLAPRGRLCISLPRYHKVLDYQSVQKNASPLGRTVETLDDYLDVCREVFIKCKEFGAVAFKDQCAYSRSLSFTNPTRADAERVFNWLMDDPRRSCAYPDGIRPLEDFLFHQFLFMARDLDLPVQIHTGYLAGLWNDVEKANASKLRSPLELHKDVKFDLFHANWPHSEDIMYLVKKYPNVAINFCWTHACDPVYCQNMLRQIISSVPHAKVHGFGADYDGKADRAWAQASIARDNIAIALADMVDIEYLHMDDAKRVAYDWLFGNPNEFYRLGL
jgi:hypothetical protein